MTSAIVAIRHVVALSSGASSAVAADRVIRRYGKDSVDLVFADTKIEDDDNYRFLWELSRYWDMWIHILADGRDPYQVGKDEHIIPNQKIHPCTYRLKIVPQIAFVKWRQSQGYRIVMHIGMNRQDAKPKRDKPFGRLFAPAKNWTALGVSVEYPLLWSPVIEHPEWYVQFDMGIKLPQMYGKGYKHANCGGRCVVQGQRDWLRTLVEWPDRYAQSETWEREQRKDPVLAPYAFLRDQRGGELKPKSLEDLRLERQHAVLSNQLNLFSLAVDVDDPSCGVECGVGNDWSQKGDDDVTA